MKTRMKFQRAFYCLSGILFVLVLSGCVTGKFGMASTELSELQIQLSNKTWLLCGILFEGQFIPLEPGHGTNNVLLFYKDGAFESSTGINILEGEWSLKKPEGDESARINFDFTSVSNEAYPDEDATKFENTYINLFNEVEKIDAYGNQFTLYDGDGKTLMKFILNNPDW